MEREKRRYIKDATIPIVGDIMQALVGTGLTPTEAGATIRHATYVLEGQAANQPQEGNQT